MTDPLIDPLSVDARLSELGWNRGELLDIADSMLAGSNSCTQNDPPGASGWMSWKEGTRRMREIGALKNFDRNEDDQISSTFDQSRQNKFAVCNTDDGTGLEDRVPQNRSKKGAATDRAVSINQGNFNGLLNEALNVFQQPQGTGTSVYWYLCVFSDGETFRVELSCPSSCEGGYFKDFQERIILIGRDDGTGVVIRREDADGDGDSGLEVPVTRRQA